MEKNPTENQNSNHADQTKSVDFSIVIPCLNEEQYLPQLLEDLSKQTFRKFEVIVVDAQSTDKTVAEAQKIKSQTEIEISILTSNQKNVSYQRNLGGKNARGKWLIFMDADNRVPNYFLQGIRYQLDKDPELDIFSCWMDVQSYNLNDQPLIELSNIGMEVYSKMAPVAPGAMIGVRKEILKEVGFDEEVKLSEDHLFLSSCKKAGYNFRYLREPRYTFSLRRFKKEGTLKMMQTYAKAQLSYLTGQKITTPPKDYPMLGGDYYNSKGSPSYFSRLQKNFAKMSRGQLTRAKHLLSVLNEF